jgi:hypothetical protein
MNRVDIIALVFNDIFHLHGTSSFSKEYINEKINAKVPVFKTESLRC